MKKLIALPVLALVAVAAPANAYCLMGTGQAAMQAYQNCIQQERMARAQEEQTRILRRMEQQQRQAETNRQAACFGSRDYFRCMQAGGY